MSPRWEDLDARARGMSTRLLPEAELDRLAGLPDLEALVRALPAPLRPPGEAPATARRVDRALGRAAGDRLGLLARWAGPSRRARLAVVFGEEDRRSLRILLRAAAAGLPTERRLDGVTATPDLPEGVLRRAARADDPAGVLAVVEDAGHPFGGLLPPATGRGPHGATDLFALETALSRAWALRAVEGAGRDRGLRRFVGRAVDLENAWTALFAPGPTPAGPPDGDARGGEGEAVAPGEEAGLHLGGGSALPAGTFRDVTGTSDRARRRELLAEAFSGTPLGRAFADPAAGAAGLEARALDARIAEERWHGRRDPLGPAPLLEYVLRLRREVRSLRRVAWGLEMGAPAGARAGGTGPGRAARGAGGEGP